ncbi:MAG: penicillin-binding protein, partial [Cytophagaceae bacterium]
LFQIASNTKLFTATAVGMLVNEGKLEWDKPVKTFVPAINFFNDELNNTVTVRDMLSHRTGISRHDLIWYKSGFTRAELFEKLKYLEPSQPLRQGFLYNNLMYAASGYIIELLTKKTWEAYLKENILGPLNMRNTVFSIADMRKDPDHFVPYNERRDTSTLFQVPWLEETDGLGPAGSLISNLEDMSHWLIAQMNKGMYNGKQVIPAAVVAATMEPAITTFNGSLAKGYNEVLNPVYGLGRGSVVYRGHQLVDHGGDLTGIHSQVAMMPQDSIGVIVFVIGDQGSPLYNIISYNVFERMLGLSLTPWSERRLKEMNAGKAAARAGREKRDAGKIPGTKPSHPADDYTGDFENETYGIINIRREADSMRLTFHK